MKVRSILVLGFVSLFLFSGSKINAQFGIGLTTSWDIYNRYVNPDDGLANGSNGSAILNLGLGPKIWVGGEAFSVSVESIANLGLLGLSLKEYKGLGSFSVPVMAKLNFGGLSGLNKDLAFGLSLGAGIQYSRTEIFYLQNSYQDLGVTRDYYRTINFQMGYGVGISGFTAHAFVRYGYNPDVEGGSNLHIGVQTDFNFVNLKKIRRPESEL